MMEVSIVERKTGDTYPIEATVKMKDGTPYPLTGVTQIVLVVSDKKDEAQDEIVELFSTGTVTDEAAGQAEFPVSAAMAALAAGKFYSEIRMTQSGFIRTTETFEYKIGKRVGSVTGA